MNLYEIPLYREDLERTYQSIISVENLNGKRILVTGATGLVGSFIIDLLIYCNEEKGFCCEICAAGRDRGKFERRFGSNHLKPFLHFLSYDLGCQPDWSISFDYIVHGAGSSFPGAFMEAPARTIQQGISGISSLVDYAVNHDVKRFLMVSSGEIYGQGQKDMPAFKENYGGRVDSMNPRSCYPITKIAGENICADYARKSNLHIVVARLCHTYGPTAIPEDDRAASYFIREAAAHKDISLKSSGAQIRSWCYVADAVSGILSILITGKSGEAYNVAAGFSTMSIREMAGMLAKIGECRVIEESADERSKAAFNPMSHGVLDPDKLESLGWKPKFKPEEGFIHSISIIKEQLKQPVVSVIIPVFNVEMYLERCLKSIVEQTYANLEVLLIDDGSTDASLEICQKWAEKDSRIRIFTKRNEGLGPTRNFGIQQAQGEYLAFVDSDDWVRPDFIEALLDGVMQNNADLAFCDYYLMTYDEDKQKFDEKSGRRYLRFEGNTTLIETPELLSRMSSVTWNKIIKKSFIQEHEILQAEKGFEDIMYTWSLLSHANRITHVKRQLYYYWINRKSSNTNRSTIEEILVSIQDAMYLLPEYGDKTSFEAHIEKYVSGLLSIPLRRLPSGSSDVKQPSREKYYQMFPLAEKIDKMKIMLFGGRNLLNVFRRIRLMNPEPEVRIDSMPPYWDGTSAFLDSVDSSGCEAVILELCGDWDSNRAFQMPEWIKGLDALAEFLLRHFREDRIFIVDSRYALGSGRYRLANWYEDAALRKQQNSELEKAVIYLKTLIKKGYFSAAPEEELLFSEEESGEPLNQYWYYDVADEIRSRLR